MVARKLQSLGDYQIIRELGRGGMGVVYEAQQTSLGRRVALKVLPAAATLSSRSLKRFYAEARAAAGLHHTNIVPVYEIGEAEGIHYFTMQYLPGHGLDKVVDELGRWERQAAAGIAETYRPPGALTVTEVARSLFAEVAAGPAAPTAAAPSAACRPPRRRPPRRRPPRHAPAEIPTGGPPPASCGTSTTGRAWPASACRQPRPLSTPTPRGWSTAT